MRIVVTGGAGRLGSAVHRLLVNAGHEVTAVGHGERDITDFDSTRAWMRSLKPDAVIHAAAWTDVDGCAREPERALRINGLGTQNVAVAAAEVGAAILYISSNEVFDGLASRAYSEYDPTRPANPYGYSKWVGEQATVAVNARHYIVRTAWLFAHGGRNFVQSILNAAKAGTPLRVVSDEVANPTYTNDLAEAIVKLVETGRFGTYHFVNEGACSRYEFARYALDCAGMADVPIEPITSRDWPRPSTPPPYCPLNNTAGPLVGIRLRPWQAAVSAFLDAENRRA